MTRKDFLKQAGITGASLLLMNGTPMLASGTHQQVSDAKAPNIGKPRSSEDIFKYIIRVNGSFDNTLYKQILGAANDFKEGDQTLNIAAANRQSRVNARQLLANTSIKELSSHNVFQDELSNLIVNALPYQLQGRFLDPTTAQRIFATRYRS